VVLSGSQPQGSLTVGHVCRDFWLSKHRVGLVTDVQWIEARDTVEHQTKHRTGTHNKCRVPVPRNCFSLTQSSPQTPDSSRMSIVCAYTFPYVNQEEGDSQLGLVTKLSKT
jgi:hypothetical protein